MADDRIRMVVEPPNPEVDADVLASAFVEQFSALLDALRQTERVGRGSDRIEWVVEELSSSSPKRVVLAPKYRTDGITPAYVARIEARFFDIVDAIQNQRPLPDDLRRTDIEVFKRLGAPTRDGRVRVTVRNGQRAVGIEETLNLHAEVVLAPETRSIGTTQGRLGQANVHNAHHFYVYPWVGPTKIRCEFPVSITDRVGEALGKWVTVVGTHVYPARSPHPEIIYATGVEILEPPETAPGIMDLRGIAEIPKGVIEYDSWEDAPHGP